MISRKPDNLFQSISIPKLAPTQFIHFTKCGNLIFIILNSSMQVIIVFMTGTSNRCLIQGCAHR